MTATAQAHTKFQVVEARGFGFGLSRKFFNTLGVFDTKEAARAVANAYDARCLPNNCPDCYDFAVINEIAAAGAVA